eukprot:scaffold17828_cov122-Cylindrotheca_fusiformis.AAC.1
MPQPNPPFYCTLSARACAGNWNSRSSRAGAAGSGLSSEVDDDDDDSKYDQHSDENTRDSVLTRTRTNFSVMQCHPSASKLEKVQYVSAPTRHFHISKNPLVDSHQSTTMAELKLDGNMINIRFIPSPASTAEKQQPQQQNKSNFPNPPNMLTRHGRYVV